MSEQSDWERWLAEHVPVLLLFARQQTRCEADAQDVLQEAAIESWERQGQGQLPPLPFVFATIRRRAIDLARTNERRASRESAAGADSPQSWFDSSAEDRERSRMLQQAMTSLPEIYRDVITLKIWAGLTFTQIADALDIPANTAASRYRYGLEQLRRTTREILA
ncbi:MAG TPA: sigma-70 family RNA polymerase sigma factor [Verrucomicrobiae bacterium]